MRLFDLLTLLLPLLLLTVARLIFVLPSVMTAVPLLGNAQHEREHFGGEPRVYGIQTEKLDVIYYWAALMALIRAKAERVLAELNYPAESAVYRQCSEEAETPAAQAKCTRRLLDLRDRQWVEDHRRYRTLALSLNRGDPKVPKPAVVAFSTDAEKNPYGKSRNDAEEKNESGRAGSEDWWSWIIDNVMFVRPQFFGRLAGELWTRNHSTIRTLFLPGNCSNVLRPSAPSDDSPMGTNCSTPALENNSAVEEAVTSSQVDNAIPAATPTEKMSKTGKSAESSAKGHDTAEEREPQDVTNAEKMASTFTKTGERTNAATLSGMHGAESEVNNVRPKLPSRTLDGEVRKRLENEEGGVDNGKARRKFETFQRVFAAKQRRIDNEAATRRERRLLRALGRLRKRTKRKLPDGEASAKEGGEPLTNVKRLRELHDFYRNLRFCTTYMQRVADNNSRLVDAVLRANDTKSVRFRMARLRRSAAVDEAERRIGHYLVDNLPILSPKLFSIFPEFSDARPSKRRADHTPTATDGYDAAYTMEEDPALSSGLLSPTLFSFYDEGAFSLPSLFALTLPRREKEAWLDLLLEVSGAGRILGDFLSGMAQKITMIRERILPAIRQLEAARRQHDVLAALRTPAQREQLERYGYAVVAGEQWQHIGSAGDEFEAISDEEVDRLIEADIRHFASLDDLAPNGSLFELTEGRNYTGGTFERLVNEFSRRTNLNATAIRPSRLKRTLKAEKLGQVRVMNPYFFRMQISDGVVFRRVVLSPKAFGLSLLTTDFFGINVLSPSAFIPAILSPHSLVGNVLSPKAFGGNLLSPVAGAFEVLSPHAFAMQILSPIAAAAGVLSPKVFIADVLSPKTLTADIGGGVAGGMFVLSPGLLQTSVGSASYYTLNVLSPSILNANFLGGGEMNVKHAFNFRTTGDSFNLN